MLLKVNNLSKSFKQGKTTISALKHISFELKAGESLSLVGPSGSGKTTLLSLLAGLDLPSSGDIEVHGTSYRHLKEKELIRLRASTMGIVFQQFHLMEHLTALENVALPLELASFSHAQQKAEELLKSVKLSHRAHHFPSQMSGGECQRVAIARALSLDPPLLFADEPSGNLDTDTGHKIMELLFSKVHEKGASLILVTHDLTLAKRSDRQIELLGGEIISSS